MCNYFYSIYRCNAGMMNKFADNVEAESLELECLAENTFQSIEWPTCKNSKKYLFGPSIIISN